MVEPPEEEALPRAGAQLLAALLWAERPPEALRPAELPLRVERLRAQLQAA